MFQNFVGIFDSGIGGLTVLRNLRTVAPQCNFLYVADHAFCPYGTKPMSQIFVRAKAICNFFVQQGASAIVVACNTASLFALQLRKMFAVPIFDVISCTCAHVAKLNCSKVLLLATKATVQSGRYRQLLSAFGKQTIAYPCGKLVTLAEKGTARPTQVAVEHCLHHALGAQADLLLLGCTHFPLFQREISNCFPQMPIVSCSNCVAQFFHCNCAGQGNTVYLSTAPPRFADVHFEKLILP